jgi:hypothetical protein
MNEYDSGTRNRSQERKTHRDYDDEIQYLLSAEEQLLQSISARSPLPQVLNGICSALDCQIGGIISLISLATDDACDAAAIGTKAALFGLFIFHSEPTKELPNSTNSPPTRTVLPPYTTGKKITRPDTSIPNRRLNMPIRLSRRRKKLIGNPKVNELAIWTRRPAAPLRRNPRIMKHLY